MEFYKIVNDHDQYYVTESGGRNYNRCWSPDIKKSKTYMKKGQARAICTRMANHYPDHPIPKIVILHITSITVIDESDRAINRQLKIAQDELQRAIQNRTSKRDRLEREIERLTEELQNLNN